MNTIRAFVAIQLPPEVKQALGEISQVLAAQLPPRVIRWVKPDRMHLTLRFLGDTELDKLSAIAAELDQVGKVQAAFDLSLGELGCFPNLRRPRVLWVGVGGDVAQLQGLKNELDQRLAPLGWPVEKQAFQAHLTLGRVRDSRPLRGLAWTAEVKPLAIPVTEIRLIESQLRPSGPVYTVRHTSPLVAFST